MGALLSRSLHDRGLSVSAFPLVGEGAAYRVAGVPIVGTQRTMPSGGFILEGTGALWRDLKAGLLGLTWRQARNLRTLGRQTDWVISLGDVYPLALARYFVRRPLIFIPTAKSDYIRGHFRWEVALMRSSCRVVFPRDAKTALSLAARGVPARYVGNLMMDALTITGEDFGLAGSEHRPVVALLPGSRQPEAFQNTALLLAVVESLAGMEQVPGFLLALSGGLAPTDLAAAVQERRWQWWAAEPTEVSRGVVGRLVWREGPAEVLVTKGRFGDVLARSQLVLGMSGTGNEQAAGLGIPVVAPPGPGPQFTRHFARDQRRLLGEAVLVVDQGPQAVAEAVRRLLADPERRAQMGAVGRARMGGRGATQRMVEQIMGEIVPGAGEGGDGRSD